MTAVVPSHVAGPGGCRHCGLPADAARSDGFCGAPYTIEAGEVRNAMQLHLVNKRSVPETYRIDVDADAPGGVSVLLPLPTVSIAALTNARVPMFLSMPREKFHSNLPVRVRVVSSASADDVAVVAATFLGPSS